MMSGGNAGKIEIGNRIGGRYEVHQILGGEGKSGMGVIYVCYDHKSHNVYALKTFQDIFLKSKEMRDCFEREALAWVHLEKYPHCVRAFFVQELDNRLFIVMEFISPDEEGRNTLTHYLEAPLSFRQTLEWAIQFCHGMEHAYSHGVIVHRDIKPDNIMITSGQVVKITDFGLAVLRSQKDVTGGGVGTPPWMAPEQFEGIADSRSDIYGFGVVLYQMVNHAGLPFNVSDPKRTLEENYQAYRNAHRNMLVPRLSSRLFPIIERCLEKDPGCRYQDFKELRDGLAQLYQEETGESPPPPPTGLELDAWEHSDKGASLYSLGFHDEAIKEYREALQLKPDDAGAYSNLGAALEAKGLLDEAINAYNNALQYKPNHAEAYNNLGIALHAKGLLDEAINAYNNALQYKPNYADAYNNLGIALHAKGLLDEAIKAYNNALQYKPGFAYAYLNMGITLYAKGLVDEAINAYNNALQYKPNYADAYNNLGVAFKAKGLLDEAIKAYNNALQYKPGFAYAYLNMGITLYAKGLVDEAITAYNKALHYKTNHADAYKHLGVALKAKGLLDEAINAFNNALQYKPNDAEAHFGLGVAFKTKGLLDEAITAYNKALHHKPNYAEAHYNLGIALQGKGRFDEAIEAFQNFIKYAPPQYAQHIKQAQQIIREIEDQR